MEELALGVVENWERKLFLVSNLMDQEKVPELEELALGLVENWEKLILNARGKLEQLVDS